MTSLVNLYNNSYKIFTPDFVSSKNLAKLQEYFSENNKTLVEFIQQYIAENSGHLKLNSVLELGCGAGGLIPPLMEYGLEYTGIDFSPIAISAAQDYSSLLNLSPRLLCRDIARNNEDLGQYDLIVDSHLLHCLTGEDRSKYFALLRRSMHEDSTLLIESMVFDKSMQIPVGYHFDTDYILTKEIKSQDVPIRSILPGRDLEEEVLQHGFKIIYLYFHKELVINPFDDYPEYNSFHLPHICRMAIKKN